MRNGLKAAAATAGLALMAPALAASADRPLATIFKDPQCGCCDSYGEYLRQNGYEIRLIPTHDLALIKQRQGIPLEIGGCHTTLVGGYFVDGHVPIATFDRLLTERPDVNGISLPGMPAGSPGMGGSKTEPFTILAVARGGAQSVYAVE